MKTNSLFAVLFAALMFAACNIKEEPCRGGENEGTLVSVVLSDGTGFAMGSRASEKDEGSEQERKVSRLEFFVFDNSGNKDGVTPYLKIEGFATKTMLQIASSGKVTFVVVANYDTDGEEGIGEMNTYNDLMKELAFREMLAESSNHNATVIPEGGFEMSGKTTADITKNSAINTVRVSLDRVVSKFSAPTFDGVNIVLSDECIAELWPGETEVQNKIVFEFEGYAFINGLNKTLLMYRDDWGPSSEEWKEGWLDWYGTDGTTAGLKYLGAEFDEEDNFSNTYSGKDKDNSWFITEPVYAYENVPDKNDDASAPGYDRDKVYAMIIKGTLTHDEATTKSRYWRINLVKDSNYTILRNKHYKIQVTDIKSCGFATPKEAVEGQPVVPIAGDTYVDVIVTINPWDIIDSSTEI